MGTDAQVNGDAWRAHSEGCAECSAYRARGHVPPALERYDENPVAAMRREARERRYGPLVDALLACVRRGEPQAVHAALDIYRDTVIRELAHLLDEPEE